MVTTFYYIFISLTHLRYLHNHTYLSLLSSLLLYYYTTLFFSTVITLAGLWFQFHHGFTVSYLSLTLFSITITIFVTLLLLLLYSTPPITPLTPYLPFTPLLTNTKLPT